MVGPAVASSFAPYQDYESKAYLRDMVKMPEAFYIHAERFGASILTSTVYG